MGRIFDFEKLLVCAKKTPKFRLFYVHELDYKIVNKILANGELDLAKSS